MYTASYFPLRTTVGATIPIVDAQIVGYAPELAAAERGIAPIAVPPVPYARFVPEQLHLATTPHLPGAGVVSMPAPGELPVGLDTVVRGAFDLFNHFVRIWVVGPDVDRDPPRKHWIEVELTLSDKQGCPIVGGIVYSGYPVLPYYVLPHGANSANFGLPRELRVSWDEQNGGGFLDNEVAVVQQEITSHSGVHVLATGPVRTRKLRLRLADFPRILRCTQYAGNRLDVEEFWGILVPYLGVVAYLEDVRYAPGVPGGLLAATQHPLKRVSQGYLEPSRTLNAVSERMAALPADLLFPSPTPPHYYPMSAASLFHTGRRYTIDVGNRTTVMQEFFISQAMEAGDQVRLYFAQGEEHCRALGGLKLTGVDAKLLDWFTRGSAATFDLGIYALDPVEGVSPLAPERDPAKDKYSTLLYRRSGLSFGASTLNCAFLRPTTARNLVAIFTCRDKGYLALKSLELVQSGHVFVAPRTARRQQIRQLNFRLIGPNLAEDYSRIGRDGFRFSIEHMVGGELKETLFEARTLSDLLQLSGVRLYANQRYLETTRDVSREEAETLPNSFERRYHQVGVHGWRRSQSGDALSWSPVEPAVHLQQYAHQPGAGSFRSYSNGENRSRTEHLGLLDGTAGPLLTALTTIRNLLGPAYQALFSLPAANSLTAGQGWGTGAGQFWEGFAAAQLGGISGLLNISSPPVPIDQTIYQTLLTYFANPVAFANGPALLGALNLSEFILLNGIGFGLNAGLGVGPASVGGSISTSQLLPAVTRTSANGVTGTITYSAGKSMRSYSQSLNDGYDESESYTDLRGGVHYRRVTRDLLQAGTVRVRTPGVNVHWQDHPLDLVVGAVPLTVSLPALADKVYDARDEWVRIRFGNGMRDGLRTLGVPETRRDGCAAVQDVVMDVWFDLKEEVVQDDY